MNTTLNQALVEELAIAILEGTEEDAIRIKTVIDTLPNAEEIHELIEEKMVGLTIKAFVSGLATQACAAFEEETKEEEINELATSIRQQLETPKSVSLEELIKQQIEEKLKMDLATLIGKQVQEDDILAEIVTEIVEQIIMDELGYPEDESELHLSLHPSSIEYYAEIFEEIFDEIVEEQGLAIEFTPKITEMVMNELVNELQYEMGATVGFVKTGDVLCPVLSIQQ